jgi:hypothetical protein
MEVGYLETFLTAIDAKLHVSAHKGFYTAEIRLVDAPMKFIGFSPSLEEAIKSAFTTAKKQITADAYGDA